MNPGATVEFNFDILCWGASLWGSNDPAVLVSENWGSEAYWHQGPLWDHFGYVENWFRNGVPVFDPLWSLPWVRRKEEVRV